MKSTLFIALAAGCCFAAIAASSRAASQATAQAKVADGSDDRSPGLSEPTTQPAASSGSASGFAWGQASGSNGTAKAKAEVRIWRSGSDAADHSPGETADKRSAEATAGVDANGKPTTSARTRGRGTHAVGDARNGQRKDHAESANGDDKPGQNAGGAIPPMPGLPMPGLDASAEMEKMIRNADIPDDVKKQMLDQIKQMKTNPERR